MYRLLALFLLVAPAFCTKVKPCPGFPEFDFVQVADCVDECSAPVGTTMLTVVGFKADHDITSLTAQKDVNGNTLMKSTAACDSLVKDDGCPVYKDTMQVYPYHVKATEDMVGLARCVFKLYDQDSKVLGCYQYAVNVTQE